MILCLRTIIVCRDFQRYLREDYSLSVIHLAPSNLQKRVNFSSQESGETFHRQTELLIICSAVMYNLIGRLPGKIDCKEYEESINEDRSDKRHHAAQYALAC
jgi:hypothetical protein